MALLAVTSFRSSFCPLDHTSSYPSQHPAPSLLLCIFNLFPYILINKVHFLQPDSPQTGLHLPLSHISSGKCPAQLAVWIATSCSELTHCNLCPILHCTPPQMFPALSPSPDPKFTSCCVVVWVKMDPIANRGWYY